DVLKTLGVKAEGCRARLATLRRDGAMQEPFFNDRRPPLTSCEVHEMLSRIQAVRAGETEFVALSPAGALDQCSRCGATVRAAARFCSQCGGALARQDFAAPTSTALRILDLLRNGVDALRRGPAWAHVALNCFHRARRMAPRDERPLVEIARTYAALRDPSR